ncbi:hypothetical protein WICANDRAFT_81722 [Wickerhamomyces anomalus NRRL Y-366-8]|uniref:Metallo-beta-lactamase domain-containing protein n=1 Tax=Wickerhamomyces anomalus (strain ATCC 58044 / CBS 1984 / NCYC 433 / NRRL Y-366-8) TaxID=683960 RepID=A0A1E3NUW3_WICAA|nr:uncharacterized protein WICANDRAFT_81722 [Wickerhamomyces anomalus NRRL Y-366-8]ODQ56895.1 hypothetical protein WICANDRAFT_81722 [Wickerhamomyces anomalus NRRL Y-366-8]
MAGYPTPLGGVTRQINPSTIIHSTSFKRGSFLNFGNRTAIINIPNTNKLIIWSSIPVGPELEQVIQLASKNFTLENAEIIAGILPDKEHTMAAIDLKKKYPNIFLIGPSGITDKPNLKLDYAFSDSEANQVVKGSSILKDLTNLDFVFLNGHANREVVTFDKNTNTLFEADLFFNIPWDGVNKDQYPNSNQNAGLSFLTRFLNPDSRVGGFLLRKLILHGNAENRKGISAIYNEFEFDSIVMSHGSIVEKDGKAEFKKIFGSYL